VAIRREETYSVAALERIKVVAPFQAAMLRLGKYPLSANHALWLRPRFDAWLCDSADRFQLECALWLQGATMHSADQINMVVENAREWMPDLGLGIRPTGEPPRMMNQADLNRMRWDETPQPMHETAFHLPGATRAVVSRFLGSGAVLCCLLDADVDTFFQQQARMWLPRIIDPAFRAHPFYIPFLDSASLANQSSDALLEWTGNAAVYMREIPEEEGILIVSRLDVLDRLGLMLNGEEPVPR
jgi:hypothetical protein